MRRTMILFLLMAAPIIMAQNDETNRVVDGLREGYWRIEGKNGKLEEGNYKSGKKDGEWKTTNANGQLKSVITFVNGEAIGKAIFYFDDGKVMEEGYWNIDHWEGSYERYHENGNKACQFTYDNRGRRQGQQLYFHENGKVMYDGVWFQGKINGTLSVYNDKGQKTMERVYDETGKFQGSEDIIPTVQPADPYAEFKGTGTFTLFNVDGTVGRKGHFVNGTLINGEIYIYNENGKRIRTDVYKDGKKIGYK